MITMKAIELVQAEITAKIPMIDRMIPQLTSDFERAACFSGWKIKKGLCKWVRKKQPSNTAINPKMVIRIDNNICKPHFVKNKGAMTYGHSPFYYYV